LRERRGKRRRMMRRKENAEIGRGKRRYLYETDTRRSMTKGREW